MHPGLVVLWGIACSSLSAIFTSIGLTLQKKAREDCAENLENLSGNYVYIAGLCYVGVSLILKLLVYALLPLVSITILSTQTIIFSYLTDHIWIREIDNNSMVFLSLALISVGIIVATLGSNMRGDDFGPIFEIWDEVWTEESITFTVIAIALMLGVGEIFRVRLWAIPPFFKLLYGCCLAGLVAGWFGVLLRVICVGWAYHLFIDRSLLAGGVRIWLLTILTIVLGLTKAQCVKASLADFSTSDFLPIYQVLNIFCSFHKHLY
jgi:hypothetical protein